MALHKHDLGEPMNLPSRRNRRFFPDIRVTAAIGEPGTKVKGNFDGEITGVNIDETKQTRTTIELHSIGLDQSEQGRRKKATSSVAALLRKQGHFA